MRNNFLHGPTTFGGETVLTMLRAAPLLSSPAPFATTLLFASGLWLVSCAVEPVSNEAPMDDVFEPVDDESPQAIDDDDDDAGHDDDDATDPPLEEDAATLLSTKFPLSLDCGEVALAAVLMGNSGSATWTRDSGYKLGTVDDSDPFFSGATRVWLDGDITVEPGTSHLFVFELKAPDEPGVYVSDWQMVHEGVRWFGDIGSQEIEVFCEEPDPTPPPPDLATVTWLHSNVSNWPVTGNLSPITISGGQICLNYDQVGTWPIWNFNGVDVVGNPWIFIWQDEQWYAGTWEWLRPGQTCKAATSVAGDHIKVSPFDANSGWVPTSGTTYYFMVTGLARTSYHNVEERTNVVPFVWP